MKKQAQTSAFARLEKDGRVAFTDGAKVLKVPTGAACRERLIQLLETVGGDKQHSDVVKFWEDRAREVGCNDPLTRAWAIETFDQLESAWDSLFTPPPEPEVDIFGALS